MHNAKIEYSDGSDMNKKCVNDFLDTDFTHLYYLLNGTLLFALVVVLKQWQKKRDGRLFALVTNSQLTNCKPKIERKKKI